MEHIFEIFSVSRETKAKKQKRQTVKPAFSAVDVGVKEKDMVNSGTLIDCVMPNSFWLL